MKSRSRRLSLAIEITAPLILLMGWLLTAQSFRSEILRYGICIGVAAVAMYSFLRDSGRLIQGRLWVVVVTSMLYVAYFIKLFVIILLERTDLGWRYLFLQTGGEVTPAEWVDSLTIATGVMVATALIIKATHRKSVRHAWWVPLASYTTGRVTMNSASVDTKVLALALLTALSAGIAATQAAFNIGIASSASSADVEVPWRLSGVLQYSRMILLPMGFLHLNWLFDQNGASRLSFCAAVALIGNGLAGVLVTTSKAPFVESVLSLAFLWFLSGRFTFRRMLSLAFPFVLTLFFAAWGMHLRTFRGQDLSVTESLEATRQATAGEQSFVDVAVGGAIQILGRVNGIDSLAGIVAASVPGDMDRTIEILTDANRTVDSRYARDILGYDSFVNTKGTAFSPSLLGYFQFLFGSPVLTVLAMSILIITCERLFATLANLPIHLNMALMASVLSYLAILCSEGTLGAAPFQVGMRLAVAFAWEIVMRGLLGQRVSHLVTPPMLGERGGRTIVG